MEKQQRDWLAIERKIRAGVSFSEACAQAGVPEHEAGEYLTKRLRDRILVSGEVKIMAETALMTGLKKLIEIAEAPPRVKQTSVNDAGIPETYEPLNTDLTASQTLVRVGMDALKLINTMGFGTKAGSAQADSPASMNGFDLWDLKSRHLG